MEHSPPINTAVASLITDTRLSLLASADVETLILLDSHGLLMGPDESLDRYVARMRALRQNTQDLLTGTEEGAKSELLELGLADCIVIPKDVFETAGSRTRRLYDFAIDWAPGFYTNSKMGFLFAGCALYSRAEFLVVCVIRKAFLNRKKWLIYDRDELLAHELCHVAHIGFETENYEELFAYQTSTNWFRKLFGGMLRTTKETYILLGAVVTMLLAQTWNVTTRSPLEWNLAPMPQIIAGLLCVVVFILIRYLQTFYRFRRALGHLRRVVTNPDRALAILFRCSESEIRTAATTHDPERLRHWITTMAAQSPRWKIIARKYVAE